MLLAGSHAKYCHKVLNAALRMRGGAPKRDAKRGRDDAAASAREEAGEAAHPLQIVFVAISTHLQAARAARARASPSPVCP